MKKTYTILSKYRLWCFDVTIAYVVVVQVVHTYLSQILQIFVHAACSSNLLLWMFSPSIQPFSDRSTFVVSPAVSRGDTKGSILHRLSVRSSVCLSGFCPSVCLSELIILIYVTWEQGIYIDLLSSFRLCGFFVN